MASSLLTPANAQQRPQFSQVKVATFIDPNTRFLYRIISNNVTVMTAESTYRSNIKIYRVKQNAAGIPRFNDLESIQTINFHPSLVDYDISCAPDHCYLVAVTSRSRGNVELYSWKRTQFDRLEKRDSFARPHAVKLLRIHRNFYIVIAQDQLHLSSLRLSNEDEEPTRFLGCAILKFARGDEKAIRYHQFIKLPFTPLHVTHSISINPNNISRSGRPSEDHYLIFSTEKNWETTGSSGLVSSFLYSQLNDHFWPYKLPRNITLTRKPGYSKVILNFPGEPLPRPNISYPYQQKGQYQPVESCFSQLQNLLAGREIQSRKLIESSRSLWRTQDRYMAPNNMTTIRARVVVNGSVIVRGSMIESPQISLIGGQFLQPPAQLYQLIDAHSPAIVENRLKLAKIRLAHIRNKLDRAVTSNTVPGVPVRFDGKIRFYDNIQASQVTFGRQGVTNSDVRFNGLPFHQLEKELVSLQGAQDIGAKVTFLGDVVADLLEIHGEINEERYRLIDAIDITSKRVQIIENGPANIIPGQYGVQPPLRFASIGAQELVMGYNSTFNDITLVDFITKDSRDQLITGRKSFKRLNIQKLDLGSPSVLLNGYNISRLASNAIRIGDLSGKTYQSLFQESLFTKPIRARRLVVNNLINKRINLTSIIVDSVKINDASIQQISGFKHFMGGVKINRLTTDGSINGVRINQVFNLNPLPPRPDFGGYANPNVSTITPLVTGQFIFNAPVEILGNLNTHLINNVDITRRAIRRVPLSEAHYYANRSNFAPQLVSGHKTFMRPLRVIDRIKLLDQQQLSTIPDNYSKSYPLINGYDFRHITAGIKRQQQNPSLIYIDNLDVEGNFVLDTRANNFTGPTTIGNHTYCPLEFIRNKLVLAGQHEQVIDTPIRLNTLRARAAFFQPGALNQWSFPDDFVLKSGVNSRGGDPSNQHIEPVYGHKSFEHIVIVPPHHASGHNQHKSGQPHRILAPGAIFGPRANINNISYSELQTFVSQERLRNSTGEIILNTLIVHGNIKARRVNGNLWPEDILLKSISSNGGYNPTPHLHRRIYSPLVFLNSSYLQVENQLVLRGPVQLDGRLNGVNLTEFSHHSVTYGDKELLSLGRPIRNKVFLGGLTVTGEMRSQGLIDGVNVDEMKARVVTIANNGKPLPIFSHKLFMSDVEFHAPINMTFLGDLPVDEYLKRIRFAPFGDMIIIPYKKSISGALRINKELAVQGLINKIDFPDLKAKAIPLSPVIDELKFNKTLTIEGDVFMDNLLIDEKNGIIDGVKLTNLLPIDSSGQNELVINGPLLTRYNGTYGNMVRLSGLLSDCEVTCDLLPIKENRSRLVTSGNDMRQLAPISYHDLQPMSQMASQRPVYPVSQPHYAQPSTYAPRPIIYNGRNVSFMRTPPPYVSYTTVTPRYPTRQVRTIDSQVQKSIKSLAARPPTAIVYETFEPKRKLVKYGQAQMVADQLNLLRAQIVTLNIDRQSYHNNLVIGFVEVALNDLASWQLPEQQMPNNDHIPGQKNFLPLDQIDYPFRPTSYHLNVGVYTGYQTNMTTVFASLGGNSSRPLPPLPIESPNSAKFFIADRGALFLLISQDYNLIQDKQRRAQCPAQDIVQTTSSLMSYSTSDPYTIVEGVHVYIFHAIENSSSFNSAFFDLYQTIDLPAIDSFETFRYQGSSYALAVSRPAQKMYLLLLRGYTGFQLVSYINAPLLDYIRVVYTADKRPALIIYQTNGMHRLMESVLI